VILADVFAVLCRVSLWHGVSGTKRPCQATNDKTTTSTFCSTCRPARGCLECSQRYHWRKRSFII